MFASESGPTSQATEHQLSAYSLATTQIKHTGKFSTRAFWLRLNEQHHKMKSSILSHTHIKNIFSSHCKYKHIWIESRRFPVHLLGNVRHKLVSMSRVSASTWPQTGDLLGLWTFAACMASLICADSLAGQHWNSFSLFKWRFNFQMSVHGKGYQLYT